jgi:hypothetical protein
MSVVNKFLSVAVAVLLALGPVAAASAATQSKPKSLQSGLPSQRLQPRGIQSKGVQTRKYVPKTISPSLTTPGTITGPGRVSPGYNCASLCATTCNRLSCADLAVAECTRERQQCRVTCRSRC